MAENSTVRTHMVGSGAAAVTYDVRGDLGTAAPDRPALLLIGSPMDAVGFGTLASHFTDRPVITYDPRGAGRNPTDTTDLEPTQHADDLHRVIQDLDAGAVDMFASSGGAINALALAAAHPGDLRRVVAHEPPTVVLLPDREMVVAAMHDIRATYRDAGLGPAMAKFIALVMYDGPLPADYLDQPAPDPAAFGLPAEDDGSRDAPLMRNMPVCNIYEPDFAALTDLGDRLVLVAGAESGEQIAARGARSVAGELGRTVVEYPSDHAGFLGGEYGQHGDPVAFAAALRASLD
ncbi:pimeloyl-ACP methyl ester carboxylesterase [Haloactinopolyspora alba]|uniref:Pimeloyl-ACP methyl ester carboxylesterase n=1 Tax=Haloactinopolyspora alba TaxID=648780 RepID=A0A2P8DVP0_9ACTN|nr:alpha/beta hydrolase [Haloactinopolyspora alba]PSL01308.1 pimeloyl-ACP methyl ester carboxylesterase [Haloactinopolyspora alba]